ncbi:hypothetical protein [Cryobacterium sp. TMS1-20-1]|uniref:hypothetical protein n=1 Tax=Cryobacterium sp. TMS1-20-1 TaxID=1259223 RepID=UPI00141B43C8|nr:hypothetical protein [Cryobacterium sp. TMS1-20-1]
MPIHRFNQILGMDRSPEAKTIRRQYQGLVDTGKVPELMSMIAFERCAADNNPDTGLLGIVYVDEYSLSWGPVLLTFGATNPSGE